MSIKNKRKDPYDLDEDDEHYTKMWESKPKKIAVIGANDDKDSEINNKLDKSTKPKQYGPASTKSSGNFLTRMKALESDYGIKVVMKGSSGTPRKVSSKRNMASSSSGPKEKFKDVKCHPKMKQFIEAEYQREKLKYPFLPEAQIISALIHRYKTHRHQSNLDRKNTSSQTRSGRKSNGSKSKKLAGRISRKSGASVDTDDNSGDEVEIGDFSDDEKDIPPPGAFALSPCNSQIKLFSKHVLTRFSRDEDSFSISDSSQETPKKGNDDRTPKEARSSKDSRKKSASKKLKFPILESASLSPETEMFSQEFPDSDLVDKIADGDVCGACHKDRDDLLVCSACQTITYCDISCQEADWNKHKKICKKLKNFHGITEDDETKKINGVDRILATKAEIIKSSLGGFNNNRRNKTTGSGDGKVKGKKVQIISQPEYAPSQVEQDPRNKTVLGGKNNETKSILKTVAVKVSLNTPPIHQLENHLLKVNEGSQEERFDRLLVSPTQAESSSSSSIQSGSRSNLLEKLTTPTGRNRKEESKIPDERFDQLLDELQRIHSSPSDDQNDKVDLSQNDQLDANVTMEDEGADTEQDIETPSCSMTTTPVNSPRLTSQVNSISAARSSSRMKQRKCTPYPTNIRDVGEMDEFEIPVRRRIEFPPEDAAHKDHLDESVEMGSNPNVVSASESSSIEMTSSGLVSVSTGDTSMCEMLQEEEGEQVVDLFSDPSQSQ